MLIFRTALRGVTHSRELITVTRSPATDRDCCSWKMSSTPFTHSGHTQKHRFFWGAFAATLCSSEVIREPAPASRRLSPIQRVPRRFTGLAVLVLAVGCVVLLADGLGVDWPKLMSASWAADVLNGPTNPQATERPAAQLCSHCHQLPEPSVLPKAAWPSTIWQMASLGGFGANLRSAPDIDAVVAWYTSEAPSTLPLPSPAAVAPSPRLQLGSGLSLPDVSRVPFISNLMITDLGGSGTADLVICDMKNGGVWRGDAAAEAWAPQKLAELESPARAEATDLDRDGRMDLVVAVLGSPMAMDHLLGQVVWLRQDAGGSFEPVVLAENLGRVADVQPVDIDGDGDTDLLVAEFGWRQTGHVYLLQHEPQADGRPQFTRIELDGNHGASRVMPIDLDQDGRLEIVALFAQEHELLRCYRHTEKGWTEIRDLYRAPHPAWGHSSVLPVDLDGDGDTDFVLTNGDSYDNALLKPYHGIRWLENQGGFEFADHQIADMPGSYSAAAADIDGDGDLDIVASALAEPETGVTDLTSMASLVWLEQTAPRTFQSNVLEIGQLRHPYLSLHDHDGDGDVDVFVGSGCFDDTLLEPHDPCVQIWTNQGR
jgi:hypothetical protein